MSLRFRHSAPALFSVASVATVLLQATPSLAADWQNNVNYGANTRMDLYVPDSPAAKPPIVVTLHYCSGNSGNAHGWLQSFADQLGFAIIAPGAGGNCFDAAPQRTGERANIVKMVEYVIENEGADASRVFAVGASSGACMTQALLAAYPDVFAAGSSLAGVPAGAWTGGNTYAWSTSGTSGGPAWGDKVRNANQGFTGTRPRVQLWHGQGDTTLTYSQSYPQQVQQWTNVFGVTDADGTMEMIKPMGAQDTWARTSYKDDSGVIVLEANSGPQNVPHDLSGRGLWGDVVRFFALDQEPDPGSGGTGGMSGAGGAGKGGAPTGGTSAGGTGSGTAGTGGQSGSAGTTSAGSGGVATSGGQGGTGPSASGTGGTAPNTAGTSSTAGKGGMSGTAGSATSGSGGAPSAGRAGAGGAAVVTPNDASDDAAADEGCGCRVGAANESAKTTGLAALGLGALGWLVRRRRR